MTPQHADREGWRFWLLLALGVGALKLVLLWLDPLLMFFLGDSESYLTTALTDWVPPDRSWLYGRVLRDVTLDNQTLDTIVPVQTVLGALTCLMLAYLLRRFLRCRRWIAVLAALLCAVEPLQLMYERFVLAETVGLFFFALFMLAILHYQRRGRAEFLVLAALAGAVAVALRTEFVAPVVLVGGVAVLWYWGLGRGARLRGRSKRIGLVVLHWLVLALVFGSLSMNDPARRNGSETGFLLLTAWSPVLARDSFEKSPLMRELIAAMDPDCKLDTVLYRDRHQWLDGCLCGRIKNHFEDRVLANNYARQQALHILRHQPLAVLDLGLRTWLMTFNDDAMIRVLDYDRGALEPYHQGFIDRVQNNYQVDVSGRNQQLTLTARYFEGMIGWLRVVVTLPLVLIGWWLLSWRRTMPASLLVATAAVALLLLTILVSPVPTMRFYHPVAWLGLIGLASLIDSLLAAGQGLVRRYHGARADQGG